ncbi:AAA family ATPase [Listeria seeligeri]|uniref:ATP-binding protein n=1 Tax=Listeria seeligeri TaxID=1640 RepID=UPI00162903A0|nr:ATP-binding protein [Listeria seeligeri]MBC1880805.1 AAA family ATPase [Listeria seeligeri]
MAFETPFKQVQGNLLLTKKGDIWAYYRLSPIFVSFTNKEAKETQKNRFEQFLAELEHYKDFELRMVPKLLELEKMNEELEKDFDPKTKKLGQYYAKETVSLLNKSLDSITRSDFIVGVKLKENVLTMDSAKSQLKNALDSVSDTFLSLFQMTRDVEDTFFDRFKKIEEDLLRLIQTVKGQRVTEDELVYLNRYNFIRDMHHSVEMESKKRSVEAVTDSIIDPTHPGFLKLQTGDCERWLTHVMVDNFDYNMQFSHLFERTQFFPFPLEVNVKAKFKNKDAVLRKSHRTKTRMKEMGNDKAETEGTVDDSVQKSRYILNRLENQINGENKKFISWMVSIVVTGKTKDECKARAKSVERTLARSRIRVVRPGADQLQLFYKFLPGQSLEGRHWIQQTTCAGLSENLFQISQRLGNNIGFYLGRINRLSSSTDLKRSIHSSRDLVFFHPFIANKGLEGAMTDSPHISITGQTGKGKSFLIKMLLMFLSMLEVETLYIDPKTETKDQFMHVANDPYYQKHFPLFCKHLKSFHYVDLEADDKNSHGVLDPLVMLTGVEAKDTAQAIIEQIYNLDDKDDVKRVLLRSIDEVLMERESGKKVGFMHVIERLIADEEKTVSNAGRLLYEQIHHSILQLVFSRGDTDGLKIEEKMTILGIKGLDLPDKNTDPRLYNNNEKNAVAIMIALSKFCSMFGMRDRNKHTCIVFDEAWMLMCSKIGAKLIQSMRRIGRTFNNALILVTQSVRDVNTEQDSGNFGVNFAFDEKDERKDILKFMNLEYDKEKENANEKLLANMIKGECLFKDVYGRTGKISVHCLFEEWAEAFKTVDQTHSSMAEKAFA